jgi:LIVCS family branched-chain amino acid:cation transporter
MLPLFDIGMGWLLPTVVAMVAMLFVGKVEEPVLAEENA